MIRFHDLTGTIIETDRTTVNMRGNITAVRVKVGLHLCSESIIWAL